MSSYFTVRFHKNKNHTWLTFASHPDEFLILHLILSVFVYLLSFSGPQVNAQITWRFFFDIFSTYLSLWPAQQSFMSGSYFWLFSQTVQFPRVALAKVPFSRESENSEKQCQEDFIWIWNSSLINNWPLSRIWNSFWGHTKNSFHPSITILKILKLGSNLLTQLNITICVWLSWLHSRFCHGVHRNVTRCLSARVTVTSYEIDRAGICSAARIRLHSKVLPQKYFWR